MGQQVVAAVAGDPALKLIGAADLKAKGDRLAVPGSSQQVPLHSSLGSLLESCRADVLVDFTVAEAALNAARLALKNGVNIVVGTTGLSEDNLKEIDKLARDNKKGAVVAANFAIGAVIMMHLANIAARYLDSAEIIELHHEKKLDAPSGTALATARGMIKARGKPFLYASAEKETLKGTRGGQNDGIAVHSVRLPGFVASQEVIFGALGQTLTIRHDTVSRESFMPGVLMAIKEVIKRRGLILGLDALLNLGE
jgi:4-hydroxy-tetrahydrodipicolinate reductase